MVGGGIEVWQGAVMADVGFSNVKSAEAWFETQTIEKRTAMIARAVLRVVAFGYPPEETLKRKFVLMSLRSVLTTAVRSLGRFADADEFEGPSANSAAQSVLAADIGASNSAANLELAAAARSTVSKDSLLSAEDLLHEAVWRDTKVPDFIAHAHAVFLTYLGSDPRWQFFHHWYAQMWAGTFTDWPLAVKVAKIEDDVWEAGLTEVAEAIRGIEPDEDDDFERPDTVPELQQKTLLEHVNRLLASPDMTALAAEGAAETLERAIAQYLKEAPANCLPNEMQHLEAVPGLFRRISFTVKSAEQSDAKARKLAEDIQVLNAKIARLEADLKKARAGTVQGIFTQSALKAAGGAFGLGVVSSLGLGLAHFFGEWPGDLTLENMRGWLSDLESATPKPDDRSLPPDIEA